MRTVLIALALICCCSPAHGQDQGYDEYSRAYQEAEATKRYLLVTADYFYPVKVDAKSHVLCRVYGEQKLAAHASLKDMGGAGVFIVDLTGGANHGTVVSLLPLKHCSEGNVRELLRLPAGTLTQRTLIWAVRVHPERPQSTECTPGAELMAHAERHSQAMCRANRQFHNLPTGIATSEIVAMSWDHNRNIVDAAVDLVKSWHDSPGHWRRLASRHERFGLDMKDNGRCWFGCGVFKN